MKKLIFIGENHACVECVNEEVIFSEDVNGIAVELIGMTKRNLSLCQRYNENSLDVTQFVSQLKEYGWRLERHALELHKPLFSTARKRGQKILPLRPWGPNDHWEYAIKYINKYLSDYGDLAAIMGYGCVDGLLKHFDLSSLNANKKFYNVHVNNGHKSPV